MKCVYCGVTLEDGEPTFWCSSDHKYLWLVWRRVCDNLGLPVTDGTTLSERVLMSGVR